MNGTVIMVSQGALAIGGVIWGSAVATTGTSYTLLGAAVLLLISLALSGPLSINFTGSLNFDPAPVTSFSHKLIYTPQPNDGPVSITVEFRVDCAQGREFMDLMREVRLIHLRNGAYSWRLHEALTRPNTFRLEINVPSWNEHLRQKERVTKAERAVLERAWSLHSGDRPPEEQIYLAVNRELLTPRQCDCQPPGAPKGPSDLQSQEIRSNCP
jgi:Transmembrane secretion effector